MGIILLPFILAAFLVGLLFSVFTLYRAWGMAPICKKPFGTAANIFICFLGITLGVLAWISVFLPLLYGVNIWTDGIPLLLLYVLLVGATPIAALPAILLYGPGKKLMKPK